MTPSIVVFDLGKVLVDFDYGIAARKLAARSRISLAEIQVHLDQSPLLVRYETGEINRRQFYDLVCEHTGFAGTIEEFGSFFGGIFTPIEPMIGLHAELRAQGIPTYLFSNTNDLAVEDIRMKFPFFKNFDGYILSCEVGAMKPHTRIYEALENLSGKRGPELLYLDDRKENIEAAAARGWHVIHHHDPVKSRAEIVRHGLLK